MIFHTLQLDILKRKTESYQSTHIPPTIVVYMLAGFHYHISLH